MHKADQSLEFGSGGRGLTAKEHKVNCARGRNVHHNCGGGGGVYRAAQLSKPNWIVHLKLANFVVSEVYLNFLKSQLVLAWEKTTSSKKTTSSGPLGIDIFILSPNSACMTQDQRSEILRRGWRIVDPEAATPTLSLVPYVVYPAGDGSGQSVILYLRLN